MYLYAQIFIKLLFNLKMVQIVWVDYESIFKIVQVSIICSVHLGTRQPYHKNELNGLY
jgi:hypothetical protein